MWAPLLNTYDLRLHLKAWCTSESTSSELAEAGAQQWDRAAVDFLDAAPQTLATWK